MACEGYTLRSYKYNDFNENGFFSRDNSLFSLKNLNLREILVH